MRLGTAKTVVVLALLFCVIAALQIEYDATASTAGAALPGTFTPFMVRLVDMGFNPAVASFGWASTMPEILDLFHSGHAEYFPDLAFLNTVDPKMSYPYAFSVLTLPIVPTSTYPDALQESFTIGRGGIANADPDWRIPYYMAINYYLELKDVNDAAHYFDIAAHTPGVPDYAESFALNFGLIPRDRDRVRDLWITVYESTNDPDTKARAAAYVERLNDFDLLEAAAKTYKQRYGAYPTSTQALVTTGILTALPQDPFGFVLTINPHDGTAGIDFNKPPAYLKAAPKQ